MEPPKPAFDMTFAPMVASEKLVVGSELPFSVSEGLLAEVQCKVKITKVAAIKVDGQVLDRIEFKAIPGPNLTGYWLIRADRSIYRVRATLTTDTGYLGAAEAPVPVVVTVSASQVP